METRVPADDGGHPPAGGTATSDASGATDHHLAAVDRNLAAVERHLAALDDRLAAVERRLSSAEASLADGLAAGLREAGEEMRRAVSDLGRLLLRDLDRLTKVLAEHRDTIVERLAPQSPEPEEAPPDGEPAAEPGTRLAGEQGRWAAFPPRRRRRRGL